MKRLSIFTLFILIIMFMVLGCSSQSGNLSGSKTDPVTLGNSSAMEESTEGNRTILEMGTLVFDLESQNVTVVPDRENASHFNVRHKVGWRLFDFTYSPSTHIAKLSVEITNGSKFSAYDTRLIVFSDDVGHQLLNPDGYTHLWKFKGIDYVNPFIKYAWDQPDHLFGTGESYTRNVKILLPGNNRDVHYALDVSFPGPCTDCKEYYEFESNDGLEQANPLPMTYNPLTDYFVHTGRIEAGDQDWFVIYLERSQMGITLVVPGIDSINNVVLSLYDDHMNLLESGITGPGLCAWVSTPFNMVDMAGTYYIKIACTGGEYDYDLSPLRWPDWNEGFSFFETEPNNSMNETDVMPRGYDPDTDPNNYTGELGGGGPDWFKIYVLTPGVLALQLIVYDCESNEMVYIELYNSSGVQLQKGTVWYKDGNVAIASHVETGIYYVKMSANTFTHRYVFEPIFIID